MAKKKQPANFFRVDTNRNTEKIGFNLIGGYRWTQGPVTQIFCGHLLFISMLKCAGMPIDQTAFAAEIDGAQYGKTYKDFTVELFGVYYGPLPDPPQSQYLLSLPGSFLIDNEAKPKTMWQTWLRRVKRSDTRAYIQETWDQKEGWQTIMMGIDAALLEHPVAEVSAQVKKVAEGLLLLQMIERRGPKQGDIRVTGDSLFERAVEACCALLEENPDQVPATADILKKARINNDTFYRRKLSIRNVREEAEKRLYQNMELITKRPLPKLESVYEKCFQCPDCGALHRCSPHLKPERTKGI